MSRRVVPGVDVSEQTVTTNQQVAALSGADLDLLTTLDGYKFPNMALEIPGIFGIRYCALVLVEDDHLWFRARHGFTEGTTPREGALWDAAWAADGPFVVDDLLDDPRFAGAPHLVGGLPVRFFASCVFHGPEGRPLGVLCLADPDPFSLDGPMRQNLAGFVTWVDMELAAIHELDRAAEVQRALLPKRVPPLDGYQVAGTCMPAKSVGGDFFDWYPIKGGMAFTLADVMGKGVGAGIIAATVRATLRSARHNTNVADAVERAADTLAEDLSEAGSFVTLFHARLRASNGQISYVDAGHGLTVVVDADGTAHRLDGRGLPLGTSFGDARERQRIILQPGGTLVTFSDGVLDLYDGSLASVEKVADIARGASSAQQVIDEIERLTRRDAAPDDVTVLVIRRDSALI